MRTRENPDFQIKLDQGGSLSRRKAKLLPDGAYLFEDELEIKGSLTTTVITCTAWLLELYELRKGEVLFISGQEEIHPTTKCFGAFYPPFSLTQPFFRNVKARLIGIAGTESLPVEFTSSPAIFELSFTKSFTGIADVLHVLNTGRNRQPVDRNPDPFWLSLKAKKLIDENHEVYPSISRVASRLGVTHAHLSRQFKRDFGMSPSVYFRRLRVADAPLRLARGEKIVQVSLDVGYNDLSRFYKQFRKTTSTSPGACKTMMRSRRR